MEFPRRQGEMEPRHIGDGVYVTFDGYQIWLRTPRDEGWHEIALDPDVFEELLEYRQELIDRSRKSIEQAIKNTEK